ncbi:hypothetical protein NFI96_002734 [Prochilodus magdalenae]|nr:hypothetical protein NFI96_002734 [Prochilodus magdalenae]
MSDRGCFCESPQRKKDLKPQMDPDVAIYPLPVLLVSLCEGQRVAAISGAGVGAEGQRSPGLRGYPLSCWRGRRQVCRKLLLPTLLLLLLVLGICLLLLHRPLIQDASNNKEPDGLDLLRGEEEKEGLEGDNALPWTHITPIGISSSVASTSFLWGVSTVPTPGPGTSSSTTIPGLSPAPSSAPPLMVTTTLPPGSGHARRCNDTEKGYCVNDGECYFIHGINQLSCKCRPGYFGPRCLQPEPLRLRMPKPSEKAEELYQKRVLTITGICVALLVVGIVCVVAYCKTKKQRKKMHNHLRQNMCVDHPNRNLANGPNHPGPGPEEIPMVDYISKNVPATERVIRHGAEASFSGSRQSSRSHNSSTRAHSSTHRHEERTWSLERTDSVLSDCPSGMLSSSVGTSKCSSPACMEARARRAGHCGFAEPHRPPLQYGDSFDSLGDSPHSDRYVSALTTPARLSPVDFHYSLPQQVPTFQITSPNASHAASLPPAARAPYPPPQEEEDHPLLLRRYQVPLHEAQRYQPYRQQQLRQSYLRDSPGSLPSSPQRPAQDEEYESTQEYPASSSSLEQPKRSGRRSWRRSRLNGHVAPRGYRPPRDYGSRSCLSDSGSEEEEEEEGESTPFLSMQNMSVPEPSTIYRPTPPAAADTRTPHSAAGRHAARSSTQGSGSSRQTHARSKPDRAAH